MKKLMCVAAALLAGVAMAKDMPSGADAMDYATMNVFNLTFSQKSVDSTGKKIETETLKGVLIVNENREQIVYVWDPKAKVEVMDNEWIKNLQKTVSAGKKYNVKCCIAEKLAMKFDTNCLSINGKVAASFTESTKKWYGAGAGSRNSLAGNMVTYTGTAESDAYGTWKASYDSASTKIYQGNTLVKSLKDGKKMSLRGQTEYILARKGAASSTFIGDAW